jgi:hypothetical protein
MKGRAVFILLFAWGFGTAAGWLWQWSKSSELRGELVAREARARAHRAIVPSPDSSLEADRLAVARLKSEVEVLRGEVERKEKYVAKELAERSKQPPPPPQPDAIFTLAFDVEGNSSLNGNPYNLDQLRVALAGLSHGQFFELRIPVPANQSPPALEAFKRKVDEIGAIAKEACAEKGLRVSLKFLQPH